jgi:hypothetical protein
MVKSIHLLKFLVTTGRSFFCFGASFLTCPYLAWIINCHQKTSLPGLLPDRIIIIKRQIIEITRGGNICFSVEKIKINKHKAASFLQKRAHPL